MYRLVLMIISSQVVFRLIYKTSASFMVSVFVQYTFGMKMLDHILFHFLVLKFIAILKMATCPLAKCA